MNEALEKSVQALRPRDLNIYLFIFSCFLLFIGQTELVVVCPARSLILPPLGKQPAFTWSFSQRERCTLQLGFCDPFTKAGLRLGPRGSARPVKGRGLSPVLRWPLFLLQQKGPSKPS